MIDFFQFRRHPSHYEESAPGPSIEVTVPIRTLGEKIKDVCIGKEEDPRQYEEPKILTEEQLKKIKEPILVDPWTIIEYHGDDPRTAIKYIEYREKKEQEHGESNQD